MAVSGSTILGNSIDFVAIDEFGLLFKNEWLQGVNLDRAVAAILAEAVYDDPDYPDARIEIHASTKPASRDPLNPNPAAGPVKRFVLVTNGRTSREFLSLVTAKLHAKELHARLKAAIDEERAALLAEEMAAPGYGAF